MFERFKGLFSKWYCPNCNRILKRKDVKYQEKFYGHYSTYWFRCLKCGSKGAKTINKRLEEIATSKINQ